MLWLYMSAVVLLVGDQLNVTVGKAMHPQAKSGLNLDQSPKSETDAMAVNRINMINFLSKPS